ncbi:MAG: hypothetical protein EA377_07105 [Phycisphaerales bacterium]|nr:MAG: hypothetical protein EA377_07105 [Phycisphaerales bacterium]
MQKIYLVRHAKAKNREKWTGDDSARPLRMRGQRQSLALAAFLESRNLVSLRTSPAQRCVQTLEPLAERSGLPLNVDESIMEGQPIQLPDQPGEHVICAHGDNIPDLLDSLDIPFEQCQTGSVWILTRDEDGCVLDAEYTRPE